ncbi:MAG: nitrate ABC transporter permease, partial [Microbacterium sp.]|nr:nitrate ABC transporter permease [Microbacterium sp.]
MTRSPFVPPLVGAVGVLAALALWEWSATAGPLADSPLPPATAAIGEAVRLLGTPATWTALGDTLTMALVGLVLAIVIGVVLGVAIGTSPLR